MKENVSITKKLTKKTKNTFFLDNGLFLNNPVINLQEINQRAKR